MNNRQIQHWLDLIAQTATKLEAHGYDMSGARDDVRTHDIRIAFEAVNTNQPQLN